MIKATILLVLALVFLVYAAAVGGAMASMALSHVGINVGWGWLALVNFVVLALSAVAKAARE